MQKKIFRALCSVFAVTIVATNTFSACGQQSNEPKSYTIQYTDDSGTHSLTVEDGGLYSLESIPQRYGYEFTGLFDSETGGRQYVSANGSALMAFEDDKNIVLFPQWEACGYTIILDYQGASVTSVRQMKVTYNSTLSTLPTDLTIEHKEFTGWYTEADGAGKQIADKHGVLPTCDKINEGTFNLDDPDGYIYLYAGFKAATYDVTLHFGNTQEQIKVEYGTDIEDIVYDTRVEGNAVLTWSKSDTASLSNVFTGKITESIHLYAAEYAPALELNTNGGDEIAPVVAKAGASVSLPTPTRENYKFIEWQDESGNAYTATTMPQESLQLKAKWQAKLVFDENGGTEVNDISLAVGETVTYPTPAKEGYIFAGWYTAEKEKYELKQMPSESVVLKAGWYEAKVKVIGNSTKEGNSAYLSANKESRQEADWRNEYDLSDVLPSTGGNVHIKATYEVRLQNGEGGIIKFGLYFYDQAVIGNDYVLGSDTAEVSSTIRREAVFESDLAMKTNTLYVAYYAKNIGTSGDRVYFKRVSIEITYPDTTNLYL